MKKFLLGILRKRHTFKRKKKKKKKEKRGKKKIIFKLNNCFYKFLLRKNTQNSYFSYLPI